MSEAIARIAGVPRIAAADIPRGHCFIRADESDPNIYIATGQPTLEGRIHSIVFAHSREIDEPSDLFRPVGDSFNHGRLTTVHRLYFLSGSPVFTTTPPQ